MKRSFKYGFLMLVLATVFFMVACGGGGDTAKDSGTEPAKEETSEEPEEKSEEPAEEGEEEPAEEGETASSDTLIYNLSSNPKTLDPSLNNAVDGSIILNNIFEGLYALDENDVPVPAIAESYDLSEDLLTYTFHLIEDAVWNDGVTVTAHDFEFSWKRAMSPEAAAEYAYLFYYIEGAEEYNTGGGDVNDVAVKALDDFTLEVTLKNPTNYFLALCAFPTYFPLREDIVTADEGRWFLNPETYISNGKYKITQYNDKQNIWLEKSDTYRNKDEVKLQNVDIRLVEDVNTSWASYLAEDFDMIDNVPQVEIQKGVEDGIVEIFPYTGTYYLVYNLNEEKAATVNADAAKVLQDVRVRKALSLAIDRKVITENVAQGGQTPAYSFVPPAITNHDGTTFAAKEYYNPEGDLEEAKKLMAEAGYPDGEGFPILTYSYNSGAGHEAIAGALQGMWKEIGVEIELKNSDWATFQTARTDGDYIVARHGWIADYNDPTSFLEILLSASGQNDSRYNNPDYDQALFNAQAETDLAKRDEYLHEAEDMLMEDLPVIPIYYYTQPKAIRPYVEGVRVSSLGAVYFDQVVVNR